MLITGKSSHHRGWQKNVRAYHFDHSTKWRMFLFSMRSSKTEGLKPLWILWIFCLAMSSVDFLCLHVNVIWMWTQTIHISWECVNSRSSVINSKMKENFLPKIEQTNNAMQLNYANEIESMWRITHFLSQYKISLQFEFHPRLKKGLCWLIASVFPCWN